MWEVNPDGTGDFVTIEAAIRAAASGDEIDIDPAYYSEALDTQGKSLTLVGVGGAELVVVDGHGAGSALKIPFTPGSLTVRGITFRGGNGTNITQPPGGRDTVGRCGGGLYMETASPLVEDCRIVANNADNGGGVFVQAGSPRFVRCVIAGNSAGNGGGLELVTDGTTLTDCEVSGNLAVFGGAIDAFRSRATIQRCRIQGNEAVEGGVLRSIDAGSSPLQITASVITNNLSTDSAAFLTQYASTALDQLTVADNNSSPTSAVVEIDSGSALITNSIIAYGGTTLRCDNGGNLTLGCVDLWSPGGLLPNCEGAAQAMNADPRFCDRPGRNYTLREDSPCLPGQGPPGCGLIGALDVGCSAAGVGTTSAATRSIRWGTLKSLYR